MSRRDREPRAQRGAARRRGIAGLVACALAGWPSVAAGGTPAAGEPMDGWRRDEPCGLLLAAPQPVARDGCAGAHCVAIDDAREVCVCKPAADGTGDTMRVSVRNGGREIGGWPVEPMLGDAGAFRVARADLDGDRRDELLVAILTSVSNGMAVQSWSVCGVGSEMTTPAARGDTRRRTRRRAPSCVAADDFPFLTMAVRTRGARGCRLLAARWLWGSEPGRGDGLYLVGRAFRVRDGELVLDPERPAIARRYLYRFAAERADAVESARVAPIAWWRDPTTRVVRCPDPLCDAAARADREAAAASGADGPREAAWKVCTCG